MLHPETNYKKQFNQLQQLVSQGEGLHLEFKRKASFPDKIVREMMAFANTQGGILLLGVNDDGSIPGLKYPEEESFAVQQALKVSRPSLPITETPIAISFKKTVIQYTIAESNRKPHYRIRADGAKESFVRVKDQSIKASKEMREIIRRNSKKIDIKFHYGENEAFLMKYLDLHPVITLEEFIKLRKIKRFDASRKLVRLVLADILKITPHEKGDLYSLAFKNESE